MTEILVLPRDARPGDMFFDMKIEKVVTDENGRTVWHYAPPYKYGITETVEMSNSTDYKILIDRPEYKTPFPAWSDEAKIQAFDRILTHFLTLRSVEDYANETFTILTEATSND